MVLLPIAAVAIVTSYELSTSKNEVQKQIMFNHPFMWGLLLNSRHTDKTCNNHVNLSGLWIIRKTGQSCHHIGCKSRGKLMEETIMHSKEVKEMLFASYFKPFINTLNGSPINDGEGCKEQKKSGLQERCSLTHDAFSVSSSNWEF